jgi:hypothetical protein
VQRQLNVFRLSLYSAPPPPRGHIWLRETSSKSGRFSARDDKPCAISTCCMHKGNTVLPGSEVPSMPRGREGGETNTVYVWPLLTSASYKRRLYGGRGEEALGGHLASFQKSLGPFDQPLQLDLPTLPPLQRHTGPKTEKI